ncbi:MAG: DUF2225 domain-containing protein, partial [Endomicrobiaceae bacterium]
LDNKSSVEDGFFSLEEANEAVRNNGSDWMNYKKRANLYLKQSDFKEAVKDYDAALKYHKFGDAEIFINKSECLKALKKYKDAVYSLDKAIAVEPDNAVLYYKRALLYKINGDAKNYLKNLNEAIEYEPEYKEAYIARINYYIMQSKYKEAHEDILFLLDFYSDNDTKYLLAKVSFHIGDYRKCIDILSEIYEVKQQETEINYYLGMSYFKTKDYENASIYLTRSIGMGYKNKAVYYSNALSFFSISNFPASLDNVNKAIELESKNYELFWLRARIYTKSNNFLKASQDYEKAVKLNSKRHDLFAEKAEYFAKNDKNIIAVKDYTNAIILDKNNPKYYYNRGLLYKKTGNNKEAELDFNRSKMLEEEQNFSTESDGRKQYDNQVNAISDETDVKNGVIFFNRGNVNLKKQKYTEAIDDFTKAIGANSKDVQSYISRSEAYLEIKEFDLALDDLLKVVKISPNSSLINCKIADIYRIKNNFKQSQHYYKISIELNPKNATAYFGYAQLGESNNMKELAVENYKKAAKLDIKISKECNSKISELMSL